jgi:hypothetical protein
MADKKPTTIEKRWEKDYQPRIEKPDGSVIDATKENTNGS